MQTLFRPRYRFEFPRDHNPVIFCGKDFCAILEQHGVRFGLATACPFDTISVKLWPWMMPLSESAPRGLTMPPLWPESMSSHGTILTQRFCQNGRSAP